MDVLELLDAAAPEPVLVTGSLPPAGRDVDLLIPPAARTDLELALDRKGFLNRDRTWARFAGADTDVVEIFTPDQWHLGDGEERSVFEDARPLEGYANLRLPSPHHTLLILALRLAYGGEGLQERHRDRLAAALEADPGAWDRAAQRAPGWRLEAGLQKLRAAYNGEVSEPQRRSGEAVTRVTRRRPTPLVIAFGGLDGSGKTTQAQALLATLERLGHDPVIVWARLEWTTLIENRTLELLARPVKMLLRLVLRPPSAPTPASEPAASEGPPAAPPPDPATDLRRRSHLLTTLWTLVVAWSHASHHRRAVLKEARRGRTVICDRYSLDAAVHLRYIYGPERGFRSATSVISWLLPKPLRAYFIDVPAEIAFERKSDSFSSSELDEQRQLYRETYSRMGFTRLSGSLPAEELSEAIARDVWLGLGSQHT